MSSKQVLDFETKYPIGYIDNSQTITFAQLSTVSNTKEQLAGGKMTGNINMSGKHI
ncbi:hypothetical protein ACJMK2_015841 [Sinanodonta woodiana]|uniref:Uncharacterized protein n=1 Tax=Sinanodonta woodiana TaxID=1069815 RepID=A0ABD3UTS7_SINWO